MQYIILIYGDERNFAQMANDPEAQKAMYAAYSRYGAEMREAGVLRGEDESLSKPARRDTQPIEAVAGVGRKAAIADPDGNLITFAEVG